MTRRLFCRRVMRRLFCRRGADYARSYRLSCHKNVENRFTEWACYSAKPIIAVLQNGAYRRKCQFQFR
eukprot:4006616-Pleurochrysis_carterae.AAC.1